MKKTKKKKAGILSVVCYIMAALFFLYGIYMVIYAVDYIQSYESTGLIDTQNVIQYVVTSSASYLGFAVLLFAAGRIIGMLKNLQPALLGTITEEITENPVDEAFEPEAAPAEALPAKETPDAFEESHVPEIGDTSSALTFHELIIDPPEGSEEAPGEEEEEEFVEEISLEEPEDTEASEDQETPESDMAESQPEPNKPLEKISSSMIRDIFEHR